MTDKHIPNERRQYEYKSVFTYTDNTSDNNDKIMENLHKQIIIDGVDVSECRFYYKEYYITDMCSLAEGLTCKECPNCYYKQLKRKEQECERLKLIVAHSCHDVLYEDSLRGQLDQLKAENKHLNDLLNQALKELEAIQDAYEERE